VAASPEVLRELRRLIQENLRIQRGAAGEKSVQYIDVTNVLDDVCARQNHAIFARRGCGKTLLLHSSTKAVATSIKAVYLNCEDFKRHSFPNVLIEILDALFGELEGNLRAWFGRKKRARDVIIEIRKSLSSLRTSPDSSEAAVRRLESSESMQSAGAKLKVGDANAGASATLGTEKRIRDETERTFSVQSDKLRDLDVLLPRLKAQVREFFDLSTGTKAVFLQIDDLYHLRRSDQAFVVDYIHRLCKDVPLFFKIATLRHASSLYVDRHGQPIGAQERHDYQPINIDYTFSDFRRTRDQNWKILVEFAGLAGMTEADTANLFKGEGFDRLVMAGGGVPRDVLSLFLEVLNTVQGSGGDRIGKDDVRILSKENFERRIQELKQDSEGDEQDTLIRGIYVLREFCLEKRINVFVVSEKDLQQNDEFRTLMYRLLDYRIIHNVGTALTHKSQEGTFQAYAIDIGCYAHLRKLDGRFTEIDVSLPELKERARSAPVFDPAQLKTLLGSAPTDIEKAIMADPTVASSPT
jgi:hypothetical protein